MNFKTVLSNAKENFVSVFRGPAVEANLFQLNGRTPLRKAIPFGIQHVLAMFAGNIAPILIVFGFLLGLCGNNQEYLAAMSAFKVQALLGALFMAGVGTLVQLFIGARLPLVIGTSFTFVPIFITIANSVVKSGGSPIDAYYQIMGSIICGGLIVGFLCLFYKYWGRLLKPIVPAMVVLGIGLSLLGSGATQFVGGSGILSLINSGQNLSVPYYAYILVALATIVAAIIWSISFKGVWKNLNIIVGIVFGYLVACCIPGMIDFSPLSIDVNHLVGSSGIIDAPRFLDFSKLRFDGVPIALVSICCLVAAVESIGDTSALAETGLGRPATNREIMAGISCDGINSAIGACFGALPLTTFSQNVGIVAQTKMVNRFTIFLGACFLFLVSFFPPVANFIYTIPDCVLGGTMVILFGSIMVIGMKMLGELGWSDKNVMIASIAVCLGYGISISGDFFSALTKSNLQWLADILGNCTLNMFVISFILSWVLPENMSINWRRKKKETKDE